VIVSGLEHHANLVPWQMACARSGAVLRHIPVRDDGTLDEPAFESLLTPRARILSLTQVSNALGTAVPVQRFVAKAKRAGLSLSLDGLAVAHGRRRHSPRLLRFLRPQDVRTDRHRSLRRFVLDAAPVAGRRRYDQTANAPGFHQRCRPGSRRARPSSAAPGLAAAVRFLESLDRERIGQRGQLLPKSRHAAAWIRGSAGCAEVGAVSFLVDGVHAHDVGTVFDQPGLPCVSATTAPCR
jgi:cysteine desulfurase/selenocysteine lyase